MPFHPFATTDFSSPTGTFFGRPLGLTSPRDGGGGGGVAQSGGPRSEQEQDEIMAQIRASLMNTGEFDTTLLDGLSRENQLLLTSLWVTIKDQEAEAGQFAERTFQGRLQIAEKFFQNRIKNDLAAGRLTEAKRANKQMELFKAQELGLGSAQLLEGRRQFEEQMKQAQTRLQLELLQSNREFQLGQQELEQRGGIADAALQQRIQEAQDRADAATRSLDLEGRGLTIEEDRLALGRERFGFEREQGREAAGLARSRFGLERELGRGGLALGEAELAQGGSQFQQALTAQERQGAIQNPFGFAAANILGLGQQPGEQAPFIQGLQNLGFGVPAGAQAGQFTPSREFFSGGLPTLGKLSQAGPTAQAAVQPFLSFTGTSPQDFQRQSAAVTPKPRQRQLR